MNAIVSIHDLMPETMEAVEETLAWLNRHQVPPVSLLVVPGRNWSPAQISRLRQLATAGHPIIAHGWRHETRPRRLFHRLHALLLSRNVAEHLDLDSAAILNLLKRSYKWFSAQALPPPRLYIPPAWALGSISPLHLRQSPFPAIECTRGILYPANGKVKTFPVTGYEADTAFRASVLRPWNRLQVRHARKTGKPLRIAIHPFDLRYRIADQLAQHIQAVTRFQNYPSPG